MSRHSLAAPLVRSSACSRTRLCSAANLLVARLLTTPPYARARGGIRMMSTRGPSRMITPSRDRYQWLPEMVGSVPPENECAPATSIRKIVPSPNRKMP